MVKQIKYNRSIKQFKLILDTIEFSGYLRNIFYYNSKYYPKGETLYYNTINGDTLFIYYFEFTNKGYNYGLDEHTIADLISETFDRKFNITIQTSVYGDIISYDKRDKIPKV